MRSPNERQSALCDALQPDVPYLTAYDAVKQALEAIVPFDKTLTTEQMVELVAPADNWIHGDREQLARRRVYKALNALASHDFKAWCTLGVPEKGIYGIMRRKQWRRPEVCPLCGK